MSEEATGTETTASETDTSQETTQAEVKGWTNDDGTLNRDRFGDDLGKHSFFDKYANIEEMVKGGINSQKMNSQKIEDWLGSDNEEAIKAQMKLRGVPDAPEDYEMKYPDTFADLPQETQDGMNDYLKENAKWAHEQGVSKEVFEAFVERDLQTTLTAHFEQEAEAKNLHDTAVAELTKEWGPKTGDNTERAENMAKMLGMDELIPIMKDNPALLKAFHDGASKIMSDDSIIEGKIAQTLDTAKDTMNEINDRMMSFKGDTNSAEYEKLVSKMTDAQRALPKQADDFDVLS